MLKTGPSSSPESRQLILATLKREGATTIASLAEKLSISNEAVRQHVVQLLRAGLIQPCKAADAPSKAPTGRPATRYCLTVDGDHLFPKHYDALTIELLETITHTCGKDAVIDVLAAMADETVREWRSSVAGKPISRQLQNIRSRFADIDRDVTVEKSNGSYRVIEHNCPFLNVALEDERLCSVAVNVLTRLLGCRVVRTERFQHGDGRCVFQISPDEKTRLNRFVLEPPVPKRRA